MSDFSDFNELYEPLTLPINGKSYTIPPLSFTAGGIVNGIIEKKPGGKKPEDETAEGVEFFRLILSPEIFDEMVADNVPDIAIARAGQAALADFKYGRSMAEVMWKTGGDPKVVKTLTTPEAPNRAARRSKSTAAVKKTQ